MRVVVRGSEKDRTHNHFGLSVVLFIQIFFMFFFHNFIISFSKSNFVLVMWSSGFPCLTIYRIRKWIRSMLQTNLILMRNSGCWFSLKSFYMNINLKHIRLCFVRGTVNHFYVSSVNTFVFNLSFLLVMFGAQLIIFSYLAKHTCAVVGFVFFVFFSLKRTSVELIINI